MTHIRALNAERAQLAQRIDELTLYAESPAFESVPYKEKIAVGCQLRAMREYHIQLDKRISYATIALAKNVNR